MTLSAPLHGAVEQFTDHLRNERQLSPYTLEAYRRDLLSCCRFLEKQQISDWNEVDNALLRRYVAGRHASGLSGRSLQRELSAIRTLFQYLIRERRCRHTPALDLRAPKAPDKLPRLLDADQANQLPDAPVEDDWLTLRHPPLLELLYSSGLRLPELASRDMRQLVLQLGEVRVTGKRKGPRVLPVRRMARQARRRWVKVRPGVSGDSQPVFVSI